MKARFKSWRPDSKVEAKVQSWFKSWSKSWKPDSKVEAKFKSTVENQKNQKPKATKKQ